MKPKAQAASSPKPKPKPASRPKVKTKPTTAKERGKRVLKYVFSRRAAKIVFVALVTSAAAYSWHVAITAFILNKEELILYAADFFNELALPYRIAQLRDLPPDRDLLVPVWGVLADEIDDTWQAPRSDGRSHEGIDIFADRGTPVYAAAAGYVLRVDRGSLGGNFVTIMGAGGKRHYYAHLHAIAQGIKRGSYVTTDTVLGFVGNTGNASTTPPHLHFGLYGGNGAENPYSLFIDRPVYTSQ